MTYQEYKALLISEGWHCAARYMGTGVESACDMRHTAVSYVLTITDAESGVVANGAISLPGFMNLVTTGNFGSPWSNKAFFVQLTRLEMIKQLVGEKLK